MKKISFCICLFLIVQSAFSVSLETAMQSQETTVISPVSIDGKAIVGAAELCAALGYERLVSAEVEPCSNGETKYGFSSKPEGGAYEIKKLRICNLAQYPQDSKLKSVTCARLI